MKNSLIKTITFSLLFQSVLITSSWAKDYRCNLHWWNDSGTFVERTDYCRKDGCCEKMCSTLQEKLGGSCTSTEFEHTTKSKKPQTITFNIQSPAQNVVLASRSLNHDDSQD